MKLHLAGERRRPRRRQARPQGADDSGILAMTDARLVNIPAKLHLAGEKRKQGRRQSRQGVEDDASSTLMSMPNIVPAIVEGPATSSAPTLSPSLGTLTELPVNMAPVPTPPTTESSTSPGTTAVVQTLSPTTESLWPTYSPTNFPIFSPAHSVPLATIVQTLTPATESLTPTMTNSKPDGSDRQIETEGPTVSAAPTATTPSAIPVPTESPVSTSLAPSPPPTTTSTTESPLTPVVPTTSPITTPVTNSPSGSPVTLPTTATPTYDPTNRPNTNTPTHKPTHIPTHAPTDAPTSHPTLGPTIPPTTNKPTNSSITATPTSAPQTDQPTMKPTSSPTARPISAPAPAGTMPPTLNLTDSPIAELSTNTVAPSLSPLYTSDPTLMLTGPVQTSGLKMILTGIEGIPDKSEWQNTTSRYYAKIYEQTYSPFTYDHKVEVTITQVASIGSRRRRGLNTVRSTNRALQSNDMALEVTYTQDMWYRSDDPNIDSATAFNPLLPLSNETLRDEYVGELKTLEGYEGLTSVSEIFISSDGDGDGDGGGDESIKGLGSGAIVGIVVGILAVLIILVLGFVHISKMKNNGDNSRDEIPTVMEFSNAQDLTSASGTAMGSSIPQSHENQTVGSMDYDYAAAYGGMGIGEASEAGGTMGSRTRQTAADADDMAIVSGVTQSGVSVFSEDPTFDQVYESDLHEEILEVYAPAGKLGVVIDTPNDGAPVVHAVKDSSPLADKIKVGDKLVAVDDEDTRTMTAIRVSKLLSRKKDNETRKLTVIRLTKK
ncbi:hypothetical protein ACHAXA_008810 [Cyclostephanos tholiformis]|uniref:PDZ domain-containing protein n=1 Tax=Cyclostephanos tholiformis TaxID=382380 RepID=A0ABD3RUZ5_9STRA